MMFQITIRKSGLFITLSALALLLTGCSPAPSVAVRVDCGSANNQGARVLVNGEFKGECPVDLMVVPGNTLVEARKDQADGSYDYAKDEQQLVADTRKRIDLELNTIFPELYYYNKATDINGINRYLAEFPEGKNAAQLLEKLENIYFENAKNLEGIESYLAKFPEGKYAAELREKIEDIFFLKATDIQGAQAYLNRYPTGKKTAEIQEKLAQLVEEKRVADEKSRVAEIEKIRKDLLAAGFVDNNDGSVTSIKTKLIWQRCSVGQRWTGETCAGEAAAFKWDEAMRLAKDGWRLPTIDELDTLVFCSSGQRKPSARPNGRYVNETNGECQGDYARPTINQWAFPNTPGGFFWSSSPYAYYSNHAWSVNFNYGYVSYYSRGYYVQVRLVRAGQ